MTLGLTLFGLAAGCGEDPGRAPAPAEKDGGAVEGALPELVELQTVAPQELNAGQMLMVTCLGLDDRGESYSLRDMDAVKLRTDPSDAVEARGAVLLVTRAGTLRVTCELPERSLVDPTPATVEVHPGRIAEVSATVDAEMVSAGSRVDVLCDAADAWGNRVSGEMISPRVQPADGNHQEGMTVLFERTGRHDILCEYPGARSHAAVVTVVPGLPARLGLAAVPPLPFHRPGEAIGVASWVADRYGNRIEDVPVVLTTGADREPVDPSGHRFPAEGVYVIAGVVDGETEDDQPVEAELEVVVDGAPPAISCDASGDGGALIAEGDTVTFRGHVADSTEVATVQVNGEPAVIDGEVFASELPAVYGVNFAEVVAVDGSGRESRRLCSFLVAESYASPGDFTGDVAWLQLAAEGIDDGDRAGEIDSLADLVVAVLDSAAMHGLIDDQLAETPTLKPSACDQSVLGVCVLRSEVIYEHLGSVAAPELALMPVDGGLAVDMVVRDIRLQLRLNGQVAGVGFDSAGEVRMNAVRASARFDLAATGGQAQVVLRPDAVDVEVSGLETDFGGVDGAIIDLVAGLFRGAVGDLIAHAVRDAVTAQTGDALSAAVRELIDEGFSTRLAITPAGLAEVAVDMGFGLSAATAQASHVAFGVGSRVRAETPERELSLGVPARTRDTVPALGAQTVAVAVDESLMNQLLYALWSGGLFDVELDGGDISGLPSALRARVAVGLPPVFELMPDGRVRLSAGAVAVEIAYPEAFGEAPVHVRAGIRLDARIEVEADHLRIADVRITELTYTVDNEELAFAQEDAVRDYLQRSMEEMLLPVLDEAIPALPIPNFRVGAVPSSGGLQLRLQSPELILAPPHIVLGGELSAR